jgi:hypothetical protein
MANRKHVALFKHGVAALECLEQRIHPAEEG